MSEKVDINQLQATVDAAIEQGRELMQERLGETAEGQDEEIRK